MTVEAVGTHVLLEFWGSERSDDAEFLGAAMAEAATEAGLHVIESVMHKFGGGGGVSGVILLAESHVTIHTWPEHGYAALDIFVCGECNPYKAIPVLKKGFQPGRVQLAEHKRGLVG